MKKLENILAENMLRFNTKNLNEDEYQSLGQSGELPMLDPEADMEHAESNLSRLESIYAEVKPKRVDMSEFKNDVRDLVSIYKDKSGNERQQQYYKAFFDLYPIATTKSTWKGFQNQIMDLLKNLVNHAESIAKGDTSNYGYRVHPWQKEKGIR
jgi:hypothetical protein